MLAVRWLPSFYWWGNWGTERSCNLLKVTNLRRDSVLFCFLNFGDLHLLGLIGKWVMIVKNMFFKMIFFLEVWGNLGEKVGSEPLARSKVTEGRPQPVPRLGRWSCNSGAFLLMTMRISKMSATQRVWDLKNQSCVRVGDEFLSCSSSWCKQSWGT